MSHFTRDAAQHARKEHIEFLKTVAPLRGDLFRYCRSLTNNPWDAEDLAQDTLFKAYSRLGDKHAGIENVKAFLFRAASNQWIDWCRRAKLPLICDDIPVEPITIGPVFEMREALMKVVLFLPPKERIAFVLKELFDYSLEEIAENLGTNTGAVKSALSRARAKVESMKTQRVSSAQMTGEGREVVEAAVVAFNRRDLNGMINLFLTTASGSAYGCFLETNSEEIRRGSMFYTINQPDGAPQPLPYPMAKCCTVNGENLFVIFGDENTIDDVFRFRVEENKFAHFDCYYCCPEVLDEIASALGMKANHHGRYYEEGV